LPTFDVSEIPFSRRGSWLNLSPVVGLHTWSADIHLISHVTGMHPILSLIPTREGMRREPILTTNPAELVWGFDDDASVRATFESATTIRIVGSGIDLALTEAAHSLTPFTGNYFFQDPLDGAYTYTSYETGRRYRITGLQGDLTATGAEALGEAVRTVTASGAEGWEIAVEEIEAARVPYVKAAEYDTLAESTAAEFTRFVDAIAGWRTHTTPAAELAAYVIWSATVEPAGFLKRESVLMSMHWMDKVWSWDHVFNALATAPGDPDLALDQYLTPFDFQDVSGALPDSVTHSEVLYNFVKPPIHGWGLRRLRERAARPLTHDELAGIYSPLAKWSRYWLDYRTKPGRVAPYYQHGNDSGWDNSTTFDHDRVVEAPDLAAFLVVQLDVLAELADELGIDESAQWREARDRIRTAMLEDLHDEGGFFALGVHSGAVSKRTSLINLVPIVAAETLPPGVSDELAHQIERHLTEWGLATQLPGSPEYEDDGYWRGPIWAPSTLLIEDGLRRGGHTELADTVSSRFRALCEASGFAENFDAISGAGLRDRAYTWTASVYLTFARDAVLRTAHS
jgi:glycogen debranching enzyme